MISDKASSMNKGMIWKNWKAHQIGKHFFDVDSRYSKLVKLGQGAYAVVCSAKDERRKGQKGDKIAIKKIMDLFSNKSDSIRILREIHILHHLAGNRHIVTIEDLMVPDPSLPFDHMYIVLGYMPADLHKIIYSSNSLTDRHICYMVYQMFCALKFIHSANIIHRDLKPSNILVNRNCHIRICDFGLARDIQTSSAQMTQYVVTRWYRAPEVICSTNYGAKIDVWAIGCILAEMLLKKALFPGDDYVVQMKLMFEILGCPEAEDLEFIDLKNAKTWAKQYIDVNRKRIKPMDFKKRFQKRDPECLELLKRTLCINPRKRISVQEALSIPFFDDVRKTDWEKPCEQKFVFCFKEDQQLTINQRRDAILKTVAVFRPEILKEKKFFIKESDNSGLNMPSPSKMVETPLASEEDQKRELGSKSRSHSGLKDLESVDVDDVGNSLGNTHLTNKK
mmetsp:Transcript_16446/g.23039  ORF Transcript_16446/g.23039 Transcript_16446/m.23039 type:complete len:450 (+) Transcript_16446:57-1406(+)